MGNFHLWLKSGKGLGFVCIKPRPEKQTLQLVEKLKCFNEGHPSNFNVRGFSKLTRRSSLSALGSSNSQEIQVFFEVCRSFVISVFLSRRVFESFRVEKPVTSKFYSCNAGDQPELVAVPARVCESAFLILHIQRPSALIPAEGYRLS